MTVTACTSPYGNYAKVTDSYNAQMADDAANELVALYPPATTHLALLQSARDAYGVELVSKLRESGYALEGTEKVNNRPNAKANAGVSLPIHYTVDTIGSGLYRVTISVSDHMMSRVYSVTGQDMRPAGAWTRKE
jgi:hypothetical protein